jgi:hypothetical protein
MIYGIELIKDIVSAASPKPSRLIAMKPVASTNRFADAAW